MEIVNATPWPFAVLPGKVRSQGWTASLVAKASFALKPGAPAEPLPTPLPLMGDVHRDDDLQSECLHDADLALFKPRADLLLSAVCHAPGGKPTSVVRVAFGVGRYTKALAIIGPRAWKKGFLSSSASDPENFLTMPVSYANAFGGAGYAKNPAGRGYENGILPVVEALEGRVTGPGDRPEPAGFGPLNRFWPQRSSKMGSYRGSWLKERWPWFPDDFDWSYFNAAPADQQLPGYLRGDEELSFENLHAKLPVYKASLPGLRIRAFLSEKLKDGRRFREVPMNLDTLHVDLEKEQLSLVWRGVAPAGSMELEELEHALCVSEGLKDPVAPAEKYKDLLPKPVVAAPPAPPPPPRQPSAMQIELAGAKEQAKKLEAANLDQVRAQAKQAGFDLDAALAKPSGVPELREALAQSRAALTAMGVKIPAFLDEQIALLAPGGKAEAALLKAVAMNAPKAPKPPLTGALLKQQAAAPGGLKTRDFTGADLSGFDLSGMDLSGAVFKDAKLTKAYLRVTQLAGAQLGGADLTGAFLNGAQLKGADFSGAVLTGADLTGADLSNADFGGCSAANAVFAAAKGAGALFPGALLEGASFEKAQLPGVDFARARLKGAKMAGAVLPKAVLTGAVLEGADLKEADLSGAAGTGADLRKALLVKVVAPGSIWEKATLDGADLSGAKLAKAMFGGASMKQVKLSAAELQGAMFPKASLQLAQALRINAFEASFEKADLSGADFSGANLYGSEFWEAVLQGTRLQGANVKATKLA